MESMTVRVTIKKLVEEGRLLRALQGVVGKSERPPPKNRYVLSIGLISSR